MSAEPSILVDVLIADTRLSVARLAIADLVGDAEVLRLAERPEPFAGLVVEPKYRLIQSLADEAAVLNFQNWLMPLGNPECCWIVRVSRIVETELQRALLTAHAAGPQWASEAGRA